MATVGIVVRTKDRPHFLARALGSITAQTYDDWEAFVVNDGGDPVAVAGVVGDLPAEHRARVTVLDHPHSLGRWPSANAGVRAATESGAAYLVLHDDDDSWAPTFLERAAGYLDQHPLAPGVVSRIEIIWEEGSAAAGYRETGREMFQGHLHDPLLGDTLLFNRFVPIGFLYRHELHDEIGPYDEALSVVGDWAFNLKILAKWSLDYLGDEPLAFWHQRPAATGVDGNSVISSGNDHEKYDALVRDAALRSYVGEHGLGLVLYLTKFIDRRFVEVEEGLRRDIYSGESGVVAYRRLRESALRRLPWRRR
ncbi:glycosyltransferase family 2 protein [Nocardioides sp. CER19]|uniref:glycosyltransferase family 2 protein n=1 Tax=Nocardioides sp. CER19 TaxID=3038538 RepID=UPI00244A0472|nr:glycosyltransferase family 2 protein [Nocardioides sp. CER19]MDH2412935.1 glycosyltransferase family 2 protein [Nocardioides sp. CER19]